MTETAFFYCVPHAETGDRQRGRMWFADGQDIRAGARSGVLKLMTRPGTYDYILWKCGDDGLERFEDATITYQLREPPPE